jgi:hypothetical protein
MADWICAAASSGTGARHVSERDERLAVLRGEIEPIGVTIYAQHYVADFPQGVAPCGFKLWLTIRRHAVRSPRDHAVTLQPSWHHRVIRSRPDGSTRHGSEAGERQSVAARARVGGERPREAVVDIGRASCGVG